MTEGHRPGLRHPRDGLETVSAICRCSGGGQTFSCCSRQPDCVTVTPFEAARLVPTYFGQPAAWAGRRLVSKHRDRAYGGAVRGEEPQPCCHGARVVKSQLLRNPRTETTLVVMALREVRSWLTHVGVLTCRPVAFLAYAVLWIVFGDGLKWHSLVTLATWGMTLVIQRAEHRDTQAMDGKLDELLKVRRRQELAYDYRPQRC